MNGKKTKVLLFDIETAPNLAYTWGKYDQNVIDFEREWYMMCFAAKWLGEDTVQTYSLPQFEKEYKKNPEDDKQLVQKLWELFNEADIIIAHNGDEFDIKKTNTRFIAHGLTPPSTYKTVDTKKVAKKYFNFNSNKLDDLGNFFNLGRKIDTGGFELWKGCMLGDLKSWKKMEEYNIQDVRLLEKVYLKMRPWMTNHPNRNLTEGTSHNCPNCGSHNTQRRGFSVTRTAKYQRFQCTDCGAWSTGDREKLEATVTR